MRQLSYSIFSVQDIDDSGAMQLALAWAAKGMYITTPNPRVGCVLVQNGRVIGAGHTQPAGQAHAEVMALRDAAARGEDVRGATAYVTLEPCSHHGRTPPCCDALIAAGVGRVVAAMTDPNPLVAGQGLRRLAEAGIAVSHGLLDREATEMNIGFFKRMRTGRPWVRLKTAASLDGATALENGVSQWITGPAARADGHAWRARACAILTGIGTVLADDPQLNVRDVATPRQPRRIIIDSRLDIPLDARILQPPPEKETMGQPERESLGQPESKSLGQPESKSLGQPESESMGRPESQHSASAACWIVCADASGPKAAALRAAGHELIELPNRAGKVDLPALMEELGRRQINELHVEAGFKLNGSLVREGCVDELLVYLAPALIGAGQGMFALGPLARLDDTVRLQFHALSQVGDDLRILARLRGASPQYAFPPPNED